MNTVILSLFNQRWSPRGHILKSLASKPHVLENCPVLGSRTARFQTVKVSLENAENLAENLQRPFVVCL